MLKIVISCGGGMSSSALSKHMKDEIKARGLEDEIKIDFIPFPLLILKKGDNLSFPIQTDKNSFDFDIAMLCPHLRYFAIRAIEENNGNVRIPMYILPTLMYGRMNLQDLIEDAEDLLALYQDSDELLYHFPEEELLERKRNTSHRRWIQKHKT